MNMFKPIILAFIGLIAPAFHVEAAAPSMSGAPDPSPVAAKTKPTTVVQSTRRATTASVAKSKNGSAPETIKAKKPAKSESKPTTKSSPRTAAKPVHDLSRTQENKLLALLNRGTAGELTAISGIAATRAAAIVGARPFQNIHEVLLVPGVGEATVESILKHGKTLTQTAAKSAKS